MEEKLNALLVQIQLIAHKKEIYEIEKLVNDISELLGEDYIIYKLNN